MGVAMDNNPFRRYIACFLIAVWGSNLPLGAEPETLGSAGLAPSAATNISFSFSAPLKRAAWQQHLTLGPGDVLNMSLLDMPETARAEMPVGPDGRISYLQAENVMAAGLTIDELRSRLEDVLKKYYQSPRTVITPGIDLMFDLTPQSESPSS